MALPPSSATMTSATAGGASGGVIIALWLLSLIDVTMPTEVAVAFAGLLAPVLHQICNIITTKLHAITYGRRSDDSDAVPQPEGAKP